MFTNISMAGTGGLVVLIEAAFRYFGVEVPEGSTLHALNAALEVIGYLLLIWGQFRRSDLFWGILRK